MFSNEVDMQLHYRTCKIAKLHPSVVLSVVEFPVAGRALLHNYLHAARVVQSSECTFSMLILV